MIHGTKGEQLRMFMTAGEIKERYQTLPGDRQEVYDLDEDMEVEETNEQTWKRKLAESRMNPRRYFANVHEGEDSVSWLSDSAHDRMREETRGRKVSLYTHTKRHGIEHPVHLSAGNYQAPFGESMDSPAVLGGHHRLAAAAHLNSEQLVPVLHHPPTKSKFIEGTFHSAKETSGPWGGYR